MKPAIFASVPRLWNRIYARIKGAMDGATGCKKWLIDRGVAAKLANLNETGTVKHGCYDALLFGKVAKVLGGNVKLMGTGSAPLDKAVVEYLKICFSCPMLEGYGLTETSAAGCGTRAADTTLGHVGGPATVIKLRLKDLPDMGYLTTDKPNPRGEVCFTGPTVFDGYYKRADKTAEAFDEEGWFMTGDVGIVLPNGAVKIIDRCKNIFKLSQGEYIAPERVEQVYALASSVGQIMIYGDPLKNCTVAIVSPDEEQVKLWAEANGKEPSSVFADPDFKAVVVDDMAQIAAAKQLSGLEKPKEIFLTSDPFSPDNGILTPTMKLRRNVARKVYQEQIDQMYSELEKRGI